MTKKRQKPGPKKQPWKHPPRKTNLYDHRRQAHVNYVTLETWALRKKAGTLAVRLRVLGLLYWERTGEFIIPVIMDQMLQVLEGEATYKGPQVVD